VKGKKTLSKIEKMGSRRGKPLEPVMIEQATIEVKNTNTP